MGSTREPTLDYFCELGHDFTGSTSGLLMCPADLLIELTDFDAGSSESIPGIVSLPLPVPVSAEFFKPFLRFSAKVRPSQGLCFSSLIFYALNRLARSGPLQIGHRFVSVRSACGALLVLCPSLVGSSVAF